MKFESVRSPSGVPRRSLRSALVSVVLLGTPGCYDFDKLYDPCLDLPTPDGCELVRGSGGAGLGGASGTGSTGGSGTGSTGSGGAGAGGSGAGGSGTGGAGTGGSGTGGSGTGGTGGGASTLAERVQRLRFNEACASRKAVELYNIGPGTIDLSGLSFSATNGAISYSSDVALSGNVGAGEFVVIADEVADCPPAFPRCFASPDFASASFSNTVANGYVTDGVEVHLLGSFDAGGGQNPLAGQCWQLVPDGSDTVGVDAETLGGPN